MCNKVQQNSYCHSLIFVNNNLETKYSGFFLTTDEMMYVSKRDNFYYILLQFQYNNTKCWWENVRSIYFC